jgi:ElaB/YqjD/DUF883 family membrane-anchored ribosome-binding protein
MSTDSQSSYGHIKDALAGGVSDLAKDASSTLGKAKNAVGQSAKDAMDGLANTDFDALKADLMKLTQTVSQLVQNQAASTRGQVMDAVGVASDNIAQSASIAQDKFGSLEADFEDRVQRNPLIAMGLAVGVGILIGKMT